MDVEYLRNALTILKASQRLFVPRAIFLGMFAGGKSDLNATLLAAQCGCRLQEESKGFYFVKI
jgi:hypothetical protein